MAEFPALSLWTDAYLGDTQHLTLEEHGAYLKLLILAWRTPDCRLVDDDDRFQTMLGIGPKKWAKLKPVVMAFWRLDEGHWTQKKLTQERLSARKQRAQKRGAAKTRWDAKPLESNDTVHAAASSPHTTLHGSPHMPPSPSPSTGSTSTTDLVLREQCTVSTLVAGATDFDEWYRLYPRKVGKLDAQRAYTTARKRASRETLLEALKRYVAECAGKEQQYIAHPGTWLNKGRWADESTTPTLAFDPDKASRERHDWLSGYALDGRWIANTSANGVWIDAHGVGPPPHDPRTLVTESDMRRFPKAQLMRDKLSKQEPRP